VLDRRYANITMPDRVELAVKAERDARTADRRILTSPFNYRDVLTRRAYLNSREVKLAEKTTSYHLHGRIEVVSGSEHFALVDAQEGRGFTDVATLPMGKRLAQRALRLLKRGGKLRDGLPTILSPRATAAIIERIAECFSASSIAAGTNFLLSDEGFSDKLHLLDDGSLLGGLRTRAFDDRGVPPVPLVLLGGGRVGGRFLSPEEARALSTRPTGHCKNGKTGPTNLILRQGTRSINAVMTERGDRAFWVDDIAEITQFDAQTGELGALVHGVILHGGASEGACRNVKMVGNLGEVFRRIIHVLSNTDRVRQVDAPALMVEGFRYEP
jgi:predicted Zn-dependent protease